MAALSRRTLLLLIGLVVVYFNTASSSPLDGEVDDPTIRCSPSSHSLVKCSLLNVVLNRPRFDIDVLVNQCHDPVDMTFYLRSLNYNWNYTYVPNNQNERVYLPDIFLNQPAHQAPTYLYVREPEVEFSERNGTTSGTEITVIASIVAVYRSMWEEEEFLNYTYSLPADNNKVCNPSYPSGTKSNIPDWLLRVVILATVPPLAVVAFMSLIAVKYKHILKRTIRRDNLNLTRNADQPAVSQNINSSSNQSSNRQIPPNSQEPRTSNNNECKTSAKNNPLQINGATNQTDGGPQNSAIASSLKKLKQNIAVSVKMNLPFKKLNEDNEAKNSLEFTKVVREGGSVTTSNPSFLSKIQATDEQTPQSHGINPTITRSGSKNNLYLDQADSSAQKYEGADSQNKDTSNGDKKNSQFDYGSRDYLDQLESSSAVNFSKMTEQQQNTLPVEKREWEHKFDESEEEEIKITFAKCKVKIKTEEEKIPAKHAVDDALHKGYFSYDVKE